MQIDKLATNHGTLQALGKYSYFTGHSLVLNRIPTNFWFDLIRRNYTVTLVVIWITWAVETWIWSIRTMAIRINIIYGNRRMDIFRAAKHHHPMKKPLRKRMIAWVLNAPWGKWLNECIILMNHSYSRFTRQFLSSSVATTTHSATEGTYEIQPNITTSTTNLININISNAGNITAVASGENHQINKCYRWVRQNVYASIKLCKNVHLSSISTVQSMHDRCVCSRQINHNKHNTLRCRCRQVLHEIHWTTASWSHNPRWLNRQIWMASQPLQRLICLNLEEPLLPWRVIIKIVRFLDRWIAIVAYVAAKLCSRRHSIRESNENRI